MESKTFGKQEFQEKFRDFFKEQESYVSGPYTFVPIKNTDSDFMVEVYEDIVTRAYGFGRKVEIDFIANYFTNPSVPEGAKRNHLLVYKYDQFIGRTLLKIGDDERIYFGVALSKKFQGKGDGTRVGREMLHLAFDIFEFPEVYGTAISYNFPSQKLMCKMGMLPCGAIDKTVKFAYDYYSVVFKIDKERFDSLDFDSFQPELQSHPLGREFRDVIMLDYKATIGVDKDTFIDSAECARMKLYIDFEVERTKENRGHKILKGIAEYHSQKGASELFYYKFLVGAGMMNIAYTKNSIMYLLSEVVPIVNQDQRNDYDPYFFATYVAGSFIFSFSHPGELSLPIKLLAPLASSVVFYLNQKYIPETLNNLSYDVDPTTQCVKFAIAGALVGTISSAFIGFFTSNPMYPVYGALHGGINSYLSCVISHNENGERAKFAKNFANTLSVLEAVALFKMDMLPVSFHDYQDALNGIHKWSSSISFLALSRQISVSILGSVFEEDVDLTGGIDDFDE